MNTATGTERRCPYCDRLVGDVFHEGKHERSVQTIEQTSKKWKAMQLAGVGIIVTGILCGIALDDGALAAAWFVFAGICVYGYARVMAWWNNG